MSGDVQPRKRKDKKKKRESLDVRKSEGELIFSRKSSLQEDEASHGVHFTKMGSDDVHLHIHEEHGTGGHWCAKIIFFSLMTILMGLVCLIILENRGISDVDTPLSESRFSNYFDGWVDESRDEHDDHHDTHESLEHDDHDEHDDDEDDHDDEPFEEEADHSEGDEEVEEEEDENVTPEEEDEDDDNATAENVTAEEEDDEEDEDDEENITAEEDVDDNATAEEADDDNVTVEDENVTEEATVEQNDKDDEDDNKTNEEDEDDNATTETSKPTSQAVQDDDDDDAFEEEDDDGTFDSLEKMVDNDAAEIELLKEKARQQAAAESKENAASAENDIEDEADNAPSWASSQIKPKTGGGPQSLEDDDLDLFEAELRNANDEMMREFNYH